MIVRLTHLHQVHRARLRPAATPEDPAALVRVDEPAPEFARFLYLAVGRPHLWSSRLDWSTARWQAEVWRPGRELWASWLRGAPIGFVELTAEARGAKSEATIEYLGLLAPHIGRGLGGQLLTEATERAWTMHERAEFLPPVDRVRVKTTSLDGDHALPNYRARGFQIERVLHRRADVVPDPPGPHGRLIWSA